MQQRSIEFGVGLFIILGLFSLLFIAFDASELDYSGGQDMVRVSADFDNISGLRVRAPVRIAGVRVGEVVAIHLDQHSYRAHVVFKIIRKLYRIPVDSEARILTEGLLGAKYVSIMPGLSEQFLKAGGRIQRTASVMVLENLIGKLIFNMNKK